MPRLSKGNSLAEGSAQDVIGQKEMPSGRAASGGRNMAAGAAYQIIISAATSDKMA